MNESMQKHGGVIKASIVLPTYNEAENIEAAVKNVLGVASSSGIDLEVVIVDDDSPDGTGMMAEDLRRRFPGKVKVLHRKAKSGLSSAIMDGFNAAANDLVGVTDADMSHEIEKIPEMIESVGSECADLCIGSRYMPSGGTRNWGNKRKALSRGAILLARPLTKIADPVSGFFFLDRKTIKDLDLDLMGYKLLLEIIVKGRHRKVVEIPYVFVNRKRGKSKLNSLEIYFYLKTLARLYLYKLGKRTN